MFNTTNEQDILLMSLLQRSGSFIAMNLDDTDKTWVSVLEARTG